MQPAIIERKKDTGKKLVPFTLSLDMRQFGEGETRSVPDTIHVAPYGKWDHPLYGEFEVSRETVREFIRNFSEGQRKPKLPITAGHDVFEEHAAIGWMTELYEGPRGLYAKVEWTAEGERLLKEGGFKYFSSEWFTRIIHQAGPMVLQPGATPGVSPDGCKNRSTAGAQRESGTNPTAWAVIECVS